MTQKTGRLTSASVDRLVRLSTSASFETGKTTLTYLDPSGELPAGDGIHYEVVLDGAELESFTMRRPSPASPRLTRRLVRDAPVDAIASLARDHVSSERFVGMNQWMLDTFEGRPLTRQDGTTVHFDMDGARKFARTAWGDFKRPGRAGRGDVDYASIAAEYVEQVHEHGGRGAVDAIADRHGLSQATVRNLLYEAARRGLKTQAAPGSAGGELTEKAIRLLSEVNSD